MAKKPQITIKDNPYTIMEVAKLFKIKPAVISTLAREVGVQLGFDYRINKYDVAKIADRLNLVYVIRGTKAGKNEIIPVDIPEEAPAIPVNAEQPRKKRKYTIEKKYGAVLPNLIWYKKDVLKNFGTKMTKYIPSIGCTKEELIEFISPRYVHPKFEGELYILIRDIRVLDLLRDSQIFPYLSRNNIRPKKFGRNDGITVADAVSMFAYYGYEFKNSKECLEAICNSYEGKPVTFPEKKSPQKVSNKVSTSVSKISQDDSKPPVEESISLAKTNTEVGYNTADVDSAIQIAIDLIDTYHTSGVKSYEGALAEARFFRALFKLKGGNVDEL
jgi:hypothetical protein